MNTNHCNHCNCEGGFDIHHIVKVVAGIQRSTLSALTLPCAPHDKVFFAVIASYNQNHHSLSHPHPLQQRHPHKFLDLQRLVADLPRLVATSPLQARDRNRSSN